MAFLPAFASHSYAYAIQILVYFPVFLIINLMFYLVAGSTPVVFSKKVFYYFGIVFILIGIGYIIFSLSFGLVSFDRWAGGNLVLYFVLIVALGSALRLFATILSK